MILAWRGLLAVVHAAMDILNDPFDWFDTRIVYIPIGKRGLGLGSTIYSKLMHLSAWLAGKIADGIGKGG